MQHVQETNLAWLLIDAVKPELDAREQNHVFISVGAGDSFAAIRILLKLIAVKRISLDPSLAQLCATWLEAYALHADHEQLGVLIDSLASTVTDIRPRMLAGLLPGTRNPAALVITPDARRDHRITPRAG